MLNISKKEMFTNKNGFRKCFRKVKGMGHSVVENADPICKELLEEASTFVTAAPRADFTESELADLTSFLESCGNVFVRAHEGGLKSNLNKFLSSYGIEVNEDALLRTVYYTFLHPKEVLITSGVKSKLFQKTVEKLQEQKKGKKARNFETEDEEEDGNRDLKFPFVYVAFELDSQLARLNSPNSNTLDTRTVQHSTQKDPHYLFSTLASSPIP